MSDVEQAMRTLFAQGGLPQRIRLDNATSGGSWSHLPPPLVGWLGLGLQPLWNPPHCRKENACVERCHGLVDTWGEPARGPDLATWQARMTWMAQTQRERYPSVAGQSRLQAYPALGVWARGYLPTQEAAQWDIQRVEAFLAPGRFARLVSKQGQISL